jgi:hypothetical protein
LEAEEGKWAQVEGCRRNPPAVDIFYDLPCYRKSSQENFTKHFFILFVNRNLGSQTFSLSIPSIAKLYSYLAMIRLKVI